ncbi:hypothetical protein E2C01_091793 [Portunus trituberculatus]|uniref:Uncharacterized protein n=1 Tax=Portunus trituberculatus TaxID=210409 RepID=A0A5B7JIH2_PORTR|nr:hypothetical protein [Portunus trituberculatus]
MQYQPSHGDTTSSGPKATAFVAYPIATPLDRLFSA